jgi:hypothetical protein
MELNEYKIERWDVVYDDKMDMKRPILYIVPDESLIEFAKINTNSLTIRMTGTGIDCYDKIGLKAELVSSSIYPNNRPNFFTSTGYYVVILKDTIWLGYPKYLGKVVFEGKFALPKKEENLKIEPPVEEAETMFEIEIPFQTENFESENNILETFSLKSNSKINIFLFLLILLFVILFVYRMKRRV